MSECRIMLAGGTLTAEGDEMEEFEEAELSQTSALLTKEDTAIMLSKYEQSLKVDMTAI